MAAWGREAARQVHGWCVVVTIGPFRGPSRRPSNRGRLLGVTPAFISDISAFDIGWFAPLSEPGANQIEPGLSAAWTQYTMGAALPLIFPDRWHQQLAEPVRYKIPVPWQQFFANDTIWQAKPASSVIVWYRPLSEPQLRKVMPAADQPWSIRLTGVG
jgi:hypothetical protein